MRGLPLSLSHGRVHARGGYFSICRWMARMAQSESGTIRSRSFLGNADLWITDLQEPHPTDDQLRSDLWWQASFPRPLFLLLVAQKHEILPISGLPQ